MVRRPASCGSSPFPPQAVREFAQFADGVELALRTCELVVEREFAGGQSAAGEPDGEGKGHKALLGAVVQVSLEPAALGVGVATMRERRLRAAGALVRACTEAMRT